MDIFFLTSFHARKQFLYQRRKKVMFWNFFYAVFFFLEKILWWFESPLMTHNQSLLRCCLKLKNKAALILRSTKPNENVVYCKLNETTEIASKGQATPTEWTLYLPLQSGQEDQDKIPLESEWKRKQPDYTPEANGVYDQREKDRNSLLFPLIAFIVLRL